jgi:Domain of unknown function (DUF4136)
MLNILFFCKMKVIINVFALALLLGMSGCSPSLMVRSDYDRQANFSQYTTYGFYDQPQAKQDAVMGSQLMLKRMTQAMTREMENRGYKYNSSNPDILVSFSTDARNMQSVQSNNNFSPFWGWGWGMGGNNVSSRNYEENRIIISLHDGKTKEMIWQGYAKGEINERNRKDREALVYDVISKIMMEYPNRAGFDNMKAISRR